MMRGLVVMTFLLLAGCDSPTGGVATGIDMRGVWEYLADQTAPALEIEGVLNITEQSGTFFTGTATLTEIDVQGTRRTRAGAVSGSFIGGSVIDFDIHLDLQSRRHVGRITPDSTNGTWSVASSPINGDFRAYKR